MPHKFKQPREQQHQRKLPHVKEELESEEPEDEAGHGGGFSISKPRQCKQPEEAYKGVTSETPAMEAMYGRIESSPLPLRRALLSSATGWKCGPSTPVPLWKMYDNPLQDVMEPANPNANSSRGVSSMLNGCPRVSVSARKLAASLWEMQGALNNQHRKGVDEIVSHEAYPDLVNSDHRHEGKESDRYFKGKEGTSQHVTCMASNHHHQHHHEGSGGPSKHLKLRKGSGKDAHLQSPGTPTLLQVEAVTGSTSFVKTSPSIGENAVRPGGEDGSALSRELVKVLNQIWSLEEQHNVSTSMVASLRVDLKKTKARVQELRKEQSSYQEDMEMLTKKLADEKSMLQDRAQEAILAAIKPLKEELEIERKSKLKLESKHKKLSKEMNEARKTLTKTVQEFEREQKARELMEDVCDELAREIGEDKAQVEELKRQSAKYREEVEQERQMLQMAEVWREERVHMKLAEARLELEEKNSALDRLRGELEAFLRAKRSLDEGSNTNLGNIASSYDQATPSALHISDKLRAFKQPNMDTAAPATSLLNEKGGRKALGELDDDSFDDDLHSIELNRKPNSGSYEDPISVHGNGSHQKAIAHSKHSVHDSTHQSLLLSPTVNGMSNGKQGGVSNVSLNRSSSQVGTELMVESNRSEIQEVDSHLIGRGFENGLKDWDLGERPVTWSRERLPSLWQNDREEFRGSSMTNVKGRNELAMDSLSRNGSKGQSAGATVSSLDLHGNGAVSKLQVFELSRDRNTAARNSDGGLLFLKQSATFPSSPTRQWAHSWSSPDPESSGKACQALEDRPQVFKDNSLKARLLEAKLEGQKEKLRNSQVC